MSMSCADAGSEPVRRFEVFTGAGRRREWSEEAKAAIVGESYSGLESVSAVARRHGLGHSQLFTWRRQLRGPMNEADRASPLLPSPVLMTQHPAVSASSLRRVTVARGAPTASINSRPNTLPRGRYATSASTLS